ncbi:MAG: glycosyltransferase family 39 protein [Bdellovibrionales bacterium]|nr:glycosyltransferase family 39 protein [Bdellovibrionales bacterium]
MLRNRNSTLLAFSGVSLLLLMPIGLFSTGAFFLAFFLLHLLIHCYMIGEGLRSLAASFQDDWKERAVFFLGIVLPMLMLVLLSSTPVINRDALIHHLAVPKWWISKGSIYEIPWHDWSYYPMLLQLGFTGFEKLGIPQLTAFYQASFLIPLAVSISHIAENQIPAPLRRLGIIMVFTTPYFFVLGSSPYVDLPLASFGIAAISLLFEEEEQQTKQLVLAGIILGLLAGCKYNGLLFSLAALGVWTVTQLRNFQIKHFSLLLCAFLLTACPWYLRNYLLVGNPVHPLFAAQLGSNNTFALPAVATGESLAALSLRNDPIEFVLTPFLMLLGFQGGDNAFGEGEMLSPLFILIPFALFTKPRLLLWKAGIALCVIYGAAALELGGARIRYLSPLFGLAVLLSLASLTILRERWRNIVVNLGIAFHILIGLSYGVHTIVERDILSVLSGEKTAKRYRNEKVTESLVADAINEVLPKNAKVYLLYTGNRYYLYDRDVYNSGYYSDRTIIAWIKNPSRPIEDSFKLKGITHIALHRSRYEKTFAQYRAKELLSKEELERWNAFTRKHFKLLYEIGPYLIGEVQ